MPLQKLAIFYHSLGKKAVALISALPYNRRIDIAIAEILHDMMKVTQVQSTSYHIEPS